MREWMVPYNPHQNGVVERKNQPILEAMRPMLYDQDLPHYLWAEACSMAIYIQNRVPHRALCKTTPKEAFTKKKQDLSHFRIFICLAYFHIVGESRSKLDQTTE